MDRLKEKIEVALREHQQESSLHQIGGHNRLLERLLDELHELLPPDAIEAGPAINGPCVP
jgi:hypothetical protein